MKDRVGFVSNSSSSSFVCDVCGEHFSGWDLSYDEAGLFGCERGHTFCGDHIVGRFESKDFLAHMKGEWNGEKKKFNMTLDEFLNDEEDNDDGPYNDEGRHEIPSCWCPLCSLEKVSSDDMLRYLSKISGKSFAQHTDDIRERFKTFEEFNDFLRA